MQTLDQKRAEHAWNRAGAIRDDKYQNLAKAAPALIMTSGLMQTLAFYNEKKGDHHDNLLKHLLTWLCSEDGKDGVLANTKPDFKSAMSALYDAEPEVYRRATEEALALLRWIRQFAGTDREK